MLIAFHVLAVIVLSLPSGSALSNRRRWETPNARADLQRWVQRLSSWGIETTPERFGHRVWTTAQSFGAARDTVAWPFEIYAQATGARQGWSMFAQPQKYPAELHVDIRTGPDNAPGAWQPLVRPWDLELDWRARERRHNRVRKPLGRIARAFYADRYRGLATWLATLAALDHPDATRVRVRLYRYRSLDPAAVLAGTKRRGHYEHELVFDAEALR